MMASFQNKLMLLLACACFVFPLTAQAEEGKDTGLNAGSETMSLTKVLQHTYKHNPQLRAARAELRATHEQLPQALAGYKPTIAANAVISDTNVSGSQTISNSAKKSAGASVTQPLFRGGRTISETKEARHKIEASLQNLYQTEQTVLFNAASAYLDVVRDQSLLKFRIANLEFIKKEHEATQNRFEVGELTKTDVSQSTSRLAGAEADVINARGQLRSDRAIFERITGLSASNLEYPESLTYEFPETLEDAINWASTYNPEVKAAKANHAAAEEEIESVWGELLPEMNIEGGWDREFESRSSDVTTRTIGVTATIPLYQGGATRSRVREAKETANQRYIEILEAIEHVKQGTVTAWTDLQTAKAEIESRKAQIKAAEVAREGVTEEARFGERTVLDVLDADQEYLDAQASLATSQRNLLVATFSLIRQLGEITPQTLGFSEDSIDHAQHLNKVTKKILSVEVNPPQ